jgi:hypothetical protein
MQTCSSELSCCFAGDKIYRWMQKVVKIRHFIFKTKSLAPTVANVVRLQNGDSSRHA